LPKGEKKRTQPSHDGERTKDDSGTESVKYRPHRDLKKGKGVKEGTAEKSLRLSIETEVLDEIRGNHSSGDAIKHGKSEEAGENEKDRKRFEKLPNLCH
jgi:hypothetical protein